MINPSITGWIDKFFIENEHNFINYENDSRLFYTTIRKSGFIYGHTITIPAKTSINIENLSQDEITKIAFLNSLYSVYTIVHSEPSKEDFIAKAVSFYNAIQQDNYSFLKKIFFPEGSPVSKLEEVINLRIQTNENFVTKNFSLIVTNALLFIDTLAFHWYLRNQTISANYIKDIEVTSTNLILLAFQVKENKTKYDEMLYKVFENSLRFTKISDLETPNLSKINFSVFQYNIERLYIMDLVEMALWSDEILEAGELEFLKELAKQLQLTKYDVNNSCKNINAFIENHREEIPYFNYSNPVKHFYEQSNKTVSKLITRNKKRLIKEISESKELMVLLAQSTTRELDKSEKKKVKKQLLDICKTVPSLTIFLLPGGGILLPILIKYIPQLLPSAFNENLEDS